jgi:hypothetical protein
MPRAYQHIVVEPKNGVYCVRFRRTQMEETELLEMADELVSLVKEDGCRKMAICLGPEMLQCLYSVFLAKLVMVRRHLMEAEGALKLCHAGPETIEVFEACHLKDLFDFAPDEATAVAAFATDETRMKHG